MLQFSRWKIFIIIGVCLFFLIAALPSVLPESMRGNIPGWLPGKPVNLGLDLQGGSQLLLELDFKSYWNEKLQSITNEVRSHLRKEKIGYKDLAVRDGSVILTLRPETIPAGLDIKKTLQNIDGDLDVTLNGDAVALSYTEAHKIQVKQKLLDQSIEIVNRRVNETGTKEPIIQRQGEDRILLQVPGLDNPEKLKNILGRTAKMTFHMVRLEVDVSALQTGIAPPGIKILPGDQDSHQRYAIDAQVELSGDMLTDASASFDESNQPVVSFQFDTEGARRFGTITSKNIGQLFAIVLDDKVITAPRIKDAILGGNGIIYGNFTPESAKELALLLRAGALPAPLTIIEERTVGPSLGADSIEAGQKACIIGVVLVMGFMLLCYGLFGLYADIALLMNLIIMLGTLALFDATLTLPGIAGIVLTLGMAVDANVLIYERIREEVRLGRSPFAAIESGFRMAFGTIVDANLTALIAAALLYYFGSGTVKGFAVTLSIGIIASMFTAITLTRLMVVVWLRRTRPKTIPL